MTFKILCCDGGGIRGLLTALLIKDLETRIPNFIANTDGFAGTSTGGLLALGLAHGKSIDDIADLYSKKCGRIFHHSWGKYTGPGKTAAQYKNDHLLEIANDMFGDTTLRETTRSMVSVDTVRLWDGISWTPCTFSNLTGNPYRGVKMADAALATSAAPAYFPPYQVIDQGNDLGFFADGGIFANNPAMTAITEAKARGAIDDLNDVRVLSLGTGRLPEGVAKISDPSSWGLTTWMWYEESHGVPAGALINVAMDCSAMAADQQARQLLGDHYSRGNFLLNPSVGLDDCDGISELESQTETYIDTDEWAGIRQWVSQNW